MSTKDFSSSPPLSPSSTDKSSVNDIPLRTTHESQKWKGQEFTPGNLNEGHIRIAMMNVHGFKKSNVSIDTAFRDFEASIEAHNIHVVCMSEHNLPTSHPSVKLKLHKAMTKASPHGKIKYHWSSSQEVSSSTRLMGGTALAVRQGIVGRLLPNGMGSDPMGRWTYAHIRRSHASPITIISIYQVCPQPTNRIGGTAWHQQRKQLNLDDRSSIHPRTAFLNDLSEFIRGLQAANHDIIVGGDWNDYLLAPNSSVLKLCTSLNLVDPWTQKFPDLKDFGTYYGGPNREGQHRIDSVLLSRSLIPSIKKIGYSPVGLVTDSDHRVLFLDLHEYEMFRDNRSYRAPFLPRVLRSNDKIAVTKFVEHVYTHLDSHSCFTRMLSLSETSLPDDTKEALVENLDKIVGEAFRAGENKITRRRSPWFSSILVKTRMEVSILCHFCRKLRARQNLMASCQTRLSVIESDIVLTTSLPDMESLLDSKRKLLQQQEVNSGKLRTQHLVDLPTGHQDSTKQLPSNINMKPMSKPKKKQPASGLNKQETSSRTWQLLSFMTNNNSHQTLDRLDIPHDWPSPTHFVQHRDELSDPKLAASWKTISDPKDIEYYLLLRNKVHFGQAHSTPFTVPPLSSELDWGGTSPFACDLLDGVWTLDRQEAISPISQVVLQSFERITVQDLVSSMITLEEFEGKMKKWNELTTTSPSTRHLGCYKSLFTKPIYPESDDTTSEYASFVDKQQQILQLIITIMNYCISTGFVLSRWKNIINTMIFKETGNFKIHKLRVIHIYEADYNLLLAVKWRQLVYSADQAGIINEHQFGGRPGCEATTLALMEELKIDISYATRRSLLTFDNDAASCYDRIIPSMASLINRQHGMPLEITRLHGQVLKNSIFRIRTSNGCSSDAYSNTSLFPIYGTGQGSGNSPAIWLLLSSFLFNIYELNSTGAAFCDPMDNIATAIHIQGFVDDTNISLNYWYPQSDENLNTLVNTLRDNAQLWSDLLHASGGKLELSKCSFHSLSFKFNPDGTPFPMRETPPPIVITDAESGQNIPIKPMSIFTPHKTLGHWKAPAGKSTTQLKELTTKAKAISLLLATSSISRYGAKIGYMGKYVQTLTYVLPQCHFLPKTLFKAQSASMPAIISKCGFSQKTPIALLYTPVELGGAGFISWPVIQGEGQIKQFIKHWSTWTSTSVLLRIDLAWTQFVSGCGFPILERPSIRLDYLETRWLSSLRNSLSLFNASIRVDQDYIFPCDRAFDKHIMDVARQSGAFTSNELKIVNYCRLYLHLATVSEMCNAQGTTIRQDVRRGHRPPWFDPTTMIVIQKRPSQHQWDTVWNLLCRMLSTHGLALGPWLPRDKPLRLRRETYEDNIGIYHWYAGAYWKCMPLNEPHNVYHMQRPTDWTPTETAVPIDIAARVQLRLYINSTSTRRYIIPPVPIAETFDQYVSGIPSQHQYLLKEVHWVIPPFECREIMFHSSPQNPILIVSDGSAKESESMTFGFVVGTSDGMTLVEGQGPCHGIPSSHRAECTGCLAAATWFQYLLEFTEPDQPVLGTYFIYSDNKAMIDSLNKRSSYTKVFPNSMLAPDSDLLESIYSIYDNYLSPKQRSFQWVKGHQDRRGGQADTLQISAVYNIRADALANEYNTFSITRKHKYLTPIEPTMGCVLDVRGRSIHGKYTRYLRASAALPRYHRYLQRKNNWSDSQVQDVDWESMGVAARNHPVTEVHLTKLVHDLLPTRCHVARFKPWINKKCYYCDCDDTIHHLQRCPQNPETASFQDNLIRWLNNFCDKRDLHPQFHRQLLNTVRDWYASSSTIDILPPIDDRARSQQHHLGLQIMTQGFLAIEWRKLLMSLPSNHDEMACPQQPRSTIKYAKTMEVMGPDGPMTIRISPSTDEESESDNDQLSSSGNCTPFMLPKARFFTHHEATVIISGIIRGFWSSLSKLWLQHLQRVHQTKHSPTSNQSPVVKNDLKNQIWYLHQLRPRVLPIHRQHYFHDDIKSFLHKATQNQLQLYVDRYEKAIYKSIKANHQSILPIPDLLPDILPPDTKEETPHRKCVRRRNSS